MRIKSGLLAAAAVFLALGAAARENPDQELIGAADAGSVRAVLRSLVKGANVNARDLAGYSPLIAASMRGNLEAAQALIEAGADVNATNAEGETPLMMIASLSERGRKGDAAKAIRSLIEAGADVNAQAPHNGWTALDYAVNLSGDAEAVSLLIKARADFDVKDNVGATPLMWAAYAGNMDAVSALLAAGADVNSRDKAGATPLISAAYAGNIYSARLLIKAGARFDIATPQGKTALIVAAERGNGRVARLLWNLQKDRFVHRRSKDVQSPSRLAAR